MITARRPSSADSAQPPSYAELYAEPPSYAESHNHPSEPAFQEEPPSYQDLQKEWESLPPEEKAKYRIENISAEDQLHFEHNQQVLARQYGRQGYVASARLDFFDLWLMSRLAGPGIRLGMHAIQGVAQFSVGAIRAAGAVTSAGGSCNGGGNPCGWAIIIGAVVVAAVACSTFIALRYAILQTQKAIENLKHSKKTGKSIFRLLGTIGTGVGVAVKCAFVGAAIGSTVPIVGTIVGAFIGACIGAGVGAFVTKYIAKCYSWIRNRNSNSVSKTNPEKYTLTPEKIERFSRIGINTHNMLSALRRQKNAATKEKKESYNLLLAQIRDKNANPANTIQIKNRLFTWNGAQNKWLDNDDNLRAYVSVRSM